MNLNIGDSNLIVKFVQYFLQEYYSKSTVATGTLDENTVYSLYKYLRRPNVETSLDMYNLILNTYTDIGTYYQISRSPNSVSLKSYGLKYRTDEVAQDAYESDQYDYTSALNCGTDSITSIYSLAKTIGWYVYSFDDYSNIGESSQCTIVLKQSNFTNRFPNNDMLCFLNLYCGTYLQDVAINSSGAFSDNESSKVAYFKAEPNTTYSITHGYTESTSMTIGCVNVEMSNPLITSNIEYYTATSIVQTSIESGECYEYTTDSNTTYIVVGLPCYSIGEVITGDTVILGDIDGDGLVTESDRTLLYYQVGTTVNGYYYSGDFYEGKEVDITTTYLNVISPVVGQVYLDLDTLTRYRYADTYVAIIPYAGGTDEFKASDINGDGVLTSADLSMLTDYVNGTGKNDLLAIYGTYSQDYNIPYSDFADDPWVIHDKFVNYMLDMAITPYSDGTDIAHLQGLMSKIYPEKMLEINGFYDDELIAAVIEFQNVNGISYSLGYLDVETEALLAELVKNGSFATLYTETYATWGSISDDYLMYSSDSESYLTFKRVRR